MVIIFVIVNLEGHGGISDESVYVVTEEEVLSGQGTFMLFYEYDDGFKKFYKM